MMHLHKNNILKHLCYTELVYQRINKKLSTTYTKKEIETEIYAIILATDISFFEKKGKNFYIHNQEQNIRITVNSNTFRVITVDKITKLKQE